MRTLWPGTAAGSWQLAEGGDDPKGLKREAWEGQFPGLTYMGAAAHMEHIHVYVSCDVLTPPGSGLG